MDPVARVCRELADENCGEFICPMDVTGVCVRENGVCGWSSIMKHPKRYICKCWKKFFTKTLVSKKGLKALDLQRKD